MSFGTPSYFPATPDSVVVGTTEVVGSGIFSNSNNVSFGVATNGVITASASVAAAPNMSMWMNNSSVGGNASAISLRSTPQFFPLNDLNPMPGAMTIGTMGIAMFGTSNVSSVDSHTISFSVGLYGLTNSTQITLLNSVSLSTGTNTSAANAYQSWYAGTRFLTIASSQWSAQPVLTAGGSYWLGIGVQTAGVLPALSFQGANRFNNPGFSGVMGSSFTNRPPVPFTGMYTATSNALPVAISVGQIDAAFSGGGATPTVAFINGISWMP